MICFKRFGWTFQISTSPATTYGCANRKDWPFILSADFAKLREAQKKGNRCKPLLVGACS
jgi:hypothetical protein